MKPNLFSITMVDWDGLMTAIHQLFNADWFVISGKFAEVHVDRAKNRLRFSTWTNNDSVDWVDFVSGLVVLRVAHKSAIELDHFCFEQHDCQYAAAGIIPSTHVSALLDMAVEYLGRELTWRHDALLAASWLYPTGDDDADDDDDATTTTPAQKFNDDIPY